MTRINGGLHGLTVTVCSDGFGDIFTSGLVLSAEGIFHGLVEARPMNCPRCQVPLTTVAGPSNLQADLCPQCEGVWLRMNLLRRFADIPVEHLKGSALQPTLEANHSKVNLEDRICCPVCRGELLRLVYCHSSGVVIDRCPEHGIWLDDGELTGVIQYIQDCVRLEAVTTSPPWTAKENTYLQAIVSPYR